MLMESELDKHPIQIPLQCNSNFSGMRDTVLYQADYQSDTKTVFYLPGAFTYCPFFTFSIFSQRGEKQGAASRAGTLNKKRHSIPTNVRLLLPLYVLSKAKKQQRDINKKKNEKELDDRTNLYS